MKTSRKFATSPDILVAKGKNSVTNATVLVAISSPVRETFLKYYTTDTTDIHMKSKKTGEKTSVIGT